MLINRTGEVLEEKPLTDGMDLGDRDLRAAIFKGNTLEGLELSGSDLRDADFSDCDLYWLDCFHANLSGASFRHSILEGANFKSACLRNVDFSGAKIGPDRLGRASSVAHADLTGAVLAGAIVAGTEYDEKTLFPVGFIPKEHGMVLAGKEEEWLSSPWCGDRETA